MIVDYDFKVIYMMDMIILRVFMFSNSKIIESHVLFDTLF